MSLTLRNGIYHFRKMVNGHMINRSTKTGNKKLAEQLAATWTSEAVKEIVLQGAKPVTLHSIIDEFLAPRVSKPGYKNIKSQLDKFKALDDVPFKEVKQSDVLGIINGLRDEGYAESTLYVLAGYYNSVIKFALEQGYNAPKKIPVPKKPKGKIRWLTLDEQKRLLDAIEPEGMYAGKCDIKDFYRHENKHLTILLLDTGARYHEIANMTWTQIDMDNKVVHIYRGKGGKDTAIYMTNRVYEVLAERNETKKDDLLFPEKYKKEGNIKWFEMAVKRAKLSAHPSLPTLHSLRHTAATTWLRNGLSLVEVQHMLGHKDIESTMVYAHIIETDAARKAADIMNKLNEKVHDA